ncbi:hypothetical protein [Bradyrhizobium sp. 141]|uniref:hypothetical protein n=1 Tax=Bradyrhizobium sp. 141 TaxID=2782617 RepID=UPI001FF7FE86|nr:hypothetical protein [Bradyrhizobium sp. 141]MCK1717204.1 hypothetical protein [Bradyrhizobium sp. 141]
MIATFLGAGIGIVSSNYLYQLISDHPDWAAASERSFFQIIALVVVGLALSIRSINT